MQTRFYHDIGRGKYHAVLHLGPGRWTAVLDLDPETRKPATYTGILGSLSSAKKVIFHLAPDAVEIPGLPAYMR